MSSARLARLTNDAFVRNWTRLFGEPPAALLDDRREMLKIAIETMPVLRNPWEPGVAPQCSERETVATWSEGRRQR
jgi:hypothetical protein